MNTRLEAKKARWLNKYRQSIDLDPFFQRGNVWNKLKQQYFIDSILREWGTPKIFLWETGKDIFACLDGKQRLTSLFNFMADQLPLNPKYSKVNDNKKYSELPRETQDKIDEYEFAVEILTGNEKDDVVELYKRLQGGTPLNFGEKLFAMSGNMNEFIKHKLASKNFLKKIVALPDTRYSHYAVCAQLCLLVIKGAKKDLKLKNLEKFFTEYSNFDNKSPESKKMLNVINYLEKAFTAEKDSSLKNRANVVSIFYLISDLSGRGNIADKAKEIGSFFRQFVRNLEKELQKKPEERDPSMLSYQSAVNQGADKIKSINIRHGILLKKLSEKNKFFCELIFPQISPKDDFIKMYEKLENKIKITNASEIDSWLIKNKNLTAIKCLSSRGKIETIIGHIRHCLHHKKHGTYTTKELTKAIKILSQALNK